MDGKVCFLAKLNDNNNDRISSICMGECAFWQITIMIGLVHCVWASVTGTSHLVSGARAIFSKGKTT